MTTAAVPPRGRVLVVDDEGNARSALAELLRDEGWQVDTAADGFKALARLQEVSPDLLLTDLRMPGLDGLGLLRKARAHDPDLGVVLMTAHGGVDSAIAAMREGAADYLLKPLNLDELALVLDRELERVQLRREAAALRARLADRDQVTRLIGQSPAMREVVETILRVAPSRSSVLISGESGTGKELVAAAIHAHSPRAKGPLVTLHCAALAETLLESELFGHERGAFTGAVARRDGRLVQAHGGTLFLDEIGEIPPATQVKLLRFLQEHELERVGGSQTVKVDVRVLAATNRDLAQLVREGRFREDLFYRLHVIDLRVPPLRERDGDVLLLAAHFLERFRKENDKAIDGFSDEALARLRAHPWPGNVRELEHAIERAAVVCRGPRIEVADLGLPSTTTSGDGASPSATHAPGAPVVPGASLAEIERWAILRTLEHVGGSTSRAAAMLQISPRTIQYRLREYQAADDGDGGDAKR